MVLYIQIVYDQGTLLRSWNALVKSKEMATTLTLEAVEKQRCAMGALLFDIGLFDPNAAEGCSRVCGILIRCFAPFLGSA